MTDEELRALAREAIARHLGGAGHAPRPGPAPVQQHPSHLRLAVLAGGEIDGPCLIEPTVRCTHCGYCQSLGH